MDKEQMNNEKWFKSLDPNFSIEAPELPVEISVGHNGPGSKIEYLWIHFGNDWIELLTEENLQSSIDKLESFRNQLLKLKIDLIIAKSI